MRITSFKSYRTNFELDGLHYSLSETESYYCKLECKETQRVWGIGHKEYDRVIDMFLNSPKHGATYVQRYELNKFETFVREIISGKKYNETTAVIESNISYHLEQIAFHINKLRELGYNEPVEY